MSLTIRIDDRLEDYRPFFDPRWADRVGALAAGTRLADPVFTLSVSWRAAANTCAMPWLLVHSLAAQWSERLDTRASLSARLAAALGDRLADEMGQSLSEAKRRKLAQVVRRIGRETKQLQELPHGLAVENGTVQVLASDTRALFDLLKRRARRLVEAAAALPQVRTADDN